MTADCDNAAMNRANFRGLRCR